MDENNSSNVEILDETNLENTPAKKKFKLTNKHIIIGAVVLGVLIIGYYFLGNKPTIGPNGAGNQVVENNEEIIDKPQVEDGSKQEPSKKFKFVKEVEEKVVIDDLEHYLLTYYYSDVVKLDIDGKEKKYYVLKKEVFFNNYRILNISDVFYSTENNIDELISKDNFNNNSRIINDKENSGKYYLYYYGTQENPIDGDNVYVKAKIINSFSYVLYNINVTNPKANGYALIEKSKMDDRFGTLYNPESVEEVVHEDGSIEYVDHSLYSIYTNSLLDIKDNKIYVATINCREINEKELTIVNGVANIKYVTTYYGDYFIPGDLCKSP